MIKQMLQLELIDGDEITPIEAMIERAEDKPTENGQEEVDRNGKFDIALKDGESDLIIRGTRTEFIKVLRFMEE